MSVGGGAVDGANPSASTAATAEDVGDGGVAVPSAVVCSAWSSGRS